MTAETEAATSSKPADRWLDKPVVPWWPALTIEKLLIILLICAVILTRFYNLGARTMAHDEVNHVVPSYTIETYVYDPVTHGPFQFHLLALSYFLFGDSDFSARVPAALFGVAVVIFTIFAWRRYLGRVGALVSAFLYVISPFILFYSRYTRNEIFIVFWGLVLLWLFLRYLEGGESKYLLWITLITALHYADKATSFIFSAEALIFLALLFIVESLRKPWRERQQRSNFLIMTLVALLAVLAGAALYLLTKGRAPARCSCLSRLLARCCWQPWFLWLSGWCAGWVGKKSASPAVLTWWCCSCCLSCRCSPPCPSSCSVSTRWITPRLASCAPWRCSWRSVCFPCCLG